MKTLRNILVMMLSFSFMFIFITKVKAQDDSEQGGQNHHSNYKFKMSGMQIEEVGEDTVVVYIKRGHDNNWGSNWSTFPWGCKKGRYNGHWAGIDFGWNGYVNSNFNMDFPASEAYMELNAARSLMVNLNPFELNLNLVNNKFGLTSGLGFQLSNYYFSSNYTLNTDNGVIGAEQLYNGSGYLVPMDVNKLYVSYLTLPIFFEFQTNAKHKVNSFHISAGVIGGVKLCSYQKQKLTTWDQTLYFGSPYGGSTSTIHPDTQKVKYKNSFYINPFKVDASVRVGWSFINLFATYSITSLFQENKGPEVYPYTVGITLLGW